MSKIQNDLMKKIEKNDKILKMSKNSFYSFFYI